MTKKQKEKFEFAKERFQDFWILSLMRRFEDGEFDKHIQCLVDDESMARKGKGIETMSITHKVVLNGGAIVALRMALGLQTTPKALKKYKKLWRQADEYP